MKDPRLKDFISVNTKPTIQTVGDYRPGNKSFLEVFPDIKKYYKSKRKENEATRKQTAARRSTMV